MKKALMPHVAQLLSSKAALRMKRACRALPRRLLRGRSKVEVFLDVADPYSYLLVQVLPELVQRYHVQLHVRSLADYQPEMFPDFTKWQRHALVDAARLAELYDLSPPCAESMTDETLSRARLGLLALEDSDAPLEDMRALFHTFHHGENLPHCPLENATARWQENASRQRKQGHYLPATLLFEGEWYWGLDRLVHLEQRLNVITGMEEVKYNRQLHWISEQGQSEKQNDGVLEMFFSARSPYSYLGLEQAVQLCERTGTQLQIKPVLPMMMRGMNVPHTKKMYIFHDTKREALAKGIPYGKVADPLGAAVERCYAVWLWAEKQGKGIDFLLAFGRKVNAEGVRADTDAGLKKIVISAGLDWGQAQASLNDQRWRDVVEENYATLSELGLWGVPCFRIGRTVVWGQDRLWVMADILGKQA